MPPRATHNCHQVVNPACGILAAMCAQCMMTAASAGAAATGARAWLATRGWSWITPTRLRRATAGLVLVAIAAAATVSG